MTLIVDSGHLPLVASNDSFAVDTGQLDSCEPIEPD